MAKSTLALKPIQRKHVTLTISGINVLVQHRWSEKAKKAMRDKQQLGVKTKTRELKNPEDEAENAAYKTAAGEYGISAMAIKSSILAAAHKDLGIEKTLVRKALFVCCDDPNMVFPFIDQSIKYEIGEDMVRVGAGSADLRYRPYWRDWSVRITFEIDTALLNTKDLVTLIDWAGSRVGIGEMRPEKGKDFGRFQINMNEEITECDI